MDAKPKRNWVLIGIAVGIALFVIPMALFFAATVVFLDDDAIDLTIPPSPPNNEQAADLPTPKVLNMPSAPPLPATQISDIDFQAYSSDLAEIVGLTDGETRLASVDKIRLFLAPEPGTRLIQTASQTFERDDGSVMVFTRIGLPDDSVKAQEIYAVFSGPGGDAKFNQTLAAYGMRIKCHRGENTTEWQAELCP